MYSHGADDALWKMELHAVATLGMMILLLVHELSMLIYLLVVLPLSFGFAFWPARLRVGAFKSRKDPESSKFGRRAHNICNVFQALTFPFVLSILIACAAAPSLYRWQPEQGWLQLSPLEVHPPARVALPMWTFWLGQVLLAMIGLAVLELLARSQKVGYNPLRGFAGILFELVGLVTGHAILWRVTDACTGAYVRCCYHNRRTCGCLGEVGLAIGVIAFFTWPMSVPACYLQEGDAFGKVLAWWLGASVVSCVFLFHAIRITKKFWSAAPERTPSHAVP